MVVIEELVLALCGDAHALSPSRALTRNYVTSLRP